MGSNGLDCFMIFLGITADDVIPGNAIGLEYFKDIFRRKGLLGIRSVHRNEFPCQTTKRCAAYTRGLAFHRIRCNNPNGKQIYIAGKMNADVPKSTYLDHVGIEGGVLGCFRIMR